MSNPVPELDDVIQYLAPTLEQHKGCTVIDFFPGSAIFSSRLHGFLKPRSHLLIEPDEFFYEPFLKPLLDARHSKYCHLKLDGFGVRAHWYNFRKTYTMRVPELPEPPLKSGVSQSGEYNPNVLVIGNASRMCKLAGKQLGIDFGIGAIRDLSADALSHDFFNQHGAVRMLWWIPEKLKPSVIPHVYMHGRSSINARAEVAYNISEVAGVQPNAAVRRARRPGYTERQRSEEFKELNRQVVRQRMQDAGLTLPRGRNFLEDLTPSDTPARDAAMSPLFEAARSTKELRKQIQEAKDRLDGLASWIARARTKSRIPQVTKGQITALSSLRYPQCRYGKYFYQNSRGQFVNNERFVIMSDMGLRLANIEAGYMNLKDGCITDGESNRLHELMAGLNENFQELIGVDKAMPGMIEDFIEDNISFYSSSPASSTERRAYEPLQAQTSHFLPEHDMTLLDFMPRGTNLSVPDLADRQESTTFLKDLLKHLFTLKGNPLPDALDKVIGNHAGRDLVHTVPAITDIRKGGRLDPTKLRVRALTPEMIEGLVKAFFEWPFRPENWQLSAAKSSREGGTEAAGTED